MSKEFNITGACNPDRHYMINLESRLKQIKILIDNGNYFTINKGRQYGKTTTLKALRKYLSTDYIVISLDFQGNMSEAEFENQFEFAEAFANAVKQALKRTIYYAELESKIAEIDMAIEKSGERFRLVKLFSMLSDLCADASKPVVLIIDEVDQATNNQVFLDFLSQLRYYYIERDEYSTFQSVILAGVHDVRNLKQKISKNSKSGHNSPWNIAIPFDVDMSFSPEDITGMLKEYEADYCTGMNISE
ncbi:MAG: ATP-binding protein, partial [Oscillospiraceae bacterium]